MAAFGIVFSFFLILWTLRAVDDAHPAARHVGVWETPPYRCPTSMVNDCPLLGNGDMGVGLGGIVASRDQATVNQSYYLGKMVSCEQVNSIFYVCHLVPSPPIALVRRPLTQIHPGFLDPAEQCRQSPRLLCARCPRARHA